MSRCLDWASTGHTSPAHTHTYTHKADNVLLFKWREGSGTFSFSGLLATVPVVSDAEKTILNIDPSTISHKPEESGVELGSDLMLMPLPFSCFC